MSATALQFISIAWVGGSILFGLIMNGEKLYSWVGNKFTYESETMHERLDVMFIQIPMEKLRQYYGAYLISLFILGMLLLYPSLGGGAVFGALFVVMGWKIPRKFVSILFNRRVKAFVLQMVDGLALMSNGLRSGLNVNQAMGLVMEELPNPIAQEFGLVLSQNKLGITLEEALSNLAVRMPNDDIEMFTTSINILKETGGNLAETFDTISNTIRERIKVESKISAMVSQGVMQGIIVVLMPFALGAVLYAIDPERIRPMFTTIPGWVLLTVMMTLQAVGAYAIWKIIQIRV